MGVTTGLGYDPVERAGVADAAFLAFLDNPFLVPADLTPYFGVAEELPDSPGAGTPFSASGVRTYVRRFVVKLRKNTYGPVVACNAPGVPRPYRLYDPHPGIETDRLALCVNLSAERAPGTSGDQAPIWIVTAQYSTDVPAGGPNLLTQLGDATFGPQYYPWQELPDVEWDAEVASQAPDTDLDGTHYFNSAAMPFNPAPTFPVAIPVLVVGKNFETFSAAQIKKYSFVVNNDHWLGQPPGSWLMEAPKVRVAWRGPRRYSRVTFRIKLKAVLPRTQPMQGLDEFGQRVELDPTIWQPLVLDAGMYKLLKKALYAGTPLEKMHVPIYRWMTAVTQPVPLDGKGDELAPAAPGDPLPDPLYLHFRQFPAEDFEPLLPAAEIEPL